MSMVAEETCRDTRLMYLHQMKEIKQLTTDVKAFAKRVAAELQQQRSR